MPKSLTKCPELGTVNFMPFCFSFIGNWQFLREIKLMCFFKHFWLIFFLDFIFEFVYFGLIFFLFCAKFVFFFGFCYFKKIHCAWAVIFMLMVAHFCSKIDFCQSLLLWINCLLCVAKPQLWVKSKKSWRQSLLSNFKSAHKIFSRSICFVLSLSSVISSSLCATQNCLPKFKVLFELIGICSGYL